MILIKVEEVEVKIGWRNYTLEPFMFLYTSANFMALSVTPNLYMDRACAVNLNYSSDICSNLSGNPSYKDDIQIYANNVSLYATLIGVFPGAIWAILVGPWSDLYGRVPFTALALVGGALQALGFALFVHFDHISVYYALLASVPGGISGGIISVMSAVYCLVANTSEPKRRAFKYGIIQGCLYMGVALSGLIAGQIYAYYSYLPVFLMQFGLMLSCLLWLLLAISDERPNKKASDLKTKIKDFFSIESLKENLQTCLRKREDHGRSQLWLLMGSMCSFFLVYNGKQKQVTRLISLIQSNLDKGSFGTQISFPLKQFPVTQVPSTRVPLSQVSNRKEEFMMNMKKFISQIPLYIVIIQF